MAEEDLSVAIRRNIYNDYQKIKEENPNSSREEILKLLYQEFVTTSIIEYETYLEQIGVIVFDYYIKYKNFISEDDFVSLFESEANLETISSYFLDEQEGAGLFSLIIDSLIDSYDEDNSFEYFHELYQNNPQALEEITRIYHPDPENYLSLYHAYCDRLKKIDTFEELDISSVYDFFLAYQVLALSLQNKSDALDQAYFKFDHYKDVDSIKRVELLSSFLMFYYSYTKDLEENGKNISSDDLDLLSLCENQPIHQVFQILDEDENMPYVNLILKTFLEHYEGEAIVSSSDKRVKSYVKQFQDKLKEG